MAKDGYIYIYKCIVGSNNDICKIGKTKHFRDVYDRMKQHSRTLYYGFVPYMDFANNTPIATGFKVKNYNKTDTLVKELLASKRVSSIEIYNIDYDLAVEQLWNFFKDNDLLIDFIQDGVSTYDFLNISEDSSIKMNTSKEVFSDIMKKILLKYGKELPDALMILLKKEKDFIENCPSHYKSGNFIDLHNGFILDIHFNKAKRIDILYKLKKLL